MTEEDSWDWLPNEILLEIYSYLSACDLATVGAVSRHWYHVSRDDLMWKKRFSTEYPLWITEKTKVSDTYFDEFLWFRYQTPKKSLQVIDDFGYSVHNVSFSAKGKFFSVCGDIGHICLYTTIPTVEFLHERCLQDDLHWKTADTVEFSPDESKFLVNGTRIDGRRELAIFSIDDAFEVHYVCRILCSPFDFMGCWLDDNYVISGEFYGFSTRTALGTSISQLWLCSVPSSRFAVSETNFLPFLRILNRGGNVSQPIVSSRVSSRFRRVLQMSDEAKNEGKSLADKIAEVKLSAQISWLDEEKEMKELKALLDQPSHCQICYLKHTLTPEEYGGNVECSCICHKSTDRLLIYLTGEFKNRVCFKLITPQFISDVVSLKHAEEVEETNISGDAYDESLEFILRRVHTPDHYIDFGGTIHHIKLSADQGLLLIALETIKEDDDGNVIGTQMEQPRINLDKMVVEGRAVFGAGPSKEPHAASGHLIAGCSENEVSLWSRDYGGPSIDRIQHPMRVRHIALHPEGSFLLSCAGDSLHIWTTHTTLSFP